MVTRESIREEIAKCTERMKAHAEKSHCKLGQIEEVATYLNSVLNDAMVEGMTDNPDFMLGVLMGINQMAKLSTMPGTMEIIDYLVAARVESDGSKIESVAAMMIAKNEEAAHLLAHIVSHAIKRYESLTFFADLGVLTPSFMCSICDEDATYTYIEVKSGPLAGKKVRVKK